MQRGKTNQQGRLNFPGFQEILDFTSAGSESSVSVSVDGDTDKEYIVRISNIGAAGIFVYLNSDSGTNYGDQQLYNNAGTIAADRNARGYLFFCAALTLGDFSILTPTGFIKSAFEFKTTYTSGTTIGTLRINGRSYNSTSNITSIDFVSASGNFTTGTRIVVYARRSQ